MQIFRTILYLKRYSFLLEQTVLRELRVRYKQTLVGVSWAVLQPLIFTTIIYFVLGHFRDQTMGHLAFANILVAMSGWTFFANTLVFATTSISGHPNLITKVAFPREVFPLSFVAVSLVDLMINMMLVVAFCLFFSLPISWSLLPVALWGILVLVTLTTALATLLSGLNVFYRDFRYVVPIFVQVLFFLTPVFYTLELLPSRVAHWIQLNPLTGVIQSLQAPLTGSAPALWGNAVVALIALEIALRIFDKLNTKMADHI